MKAVRTPMLALEDFRRVWLETEVLIRLWRAPASAPELLLPFGVLLEFAEVTVVCIAHTNLVRSMALSAQMTDASTLFMLESVGVLSVIRRSHQTAELQASAFEIQAQAKIERHIRVVRVHVQAEILAFPVANDEAMVSIPDAARPGPEQVAQWLEHLLQLIDHGLQTDLVQDDPIIVHAVW